MPASRHVTWLLLALVAAPSSSQAKEPSVVGTWKLVSYAKQAPGGAPSKVWGERPSGYLTYLPDGHMLIVLGAEKRSPAGAGAEAQAKRARLLVDLTAYAGTYTVEGDRIVHRVEVAWLPEWEGTEQPRWFRLEGDRLSVRTQPIRDPDDGKDYVYTLEYRRAPPAQGAAGGQPGSGKRVLVANTAGTSPFSRVVQAGSLVFVAGQLGFKEGTRELVPGGVVPETKAALEAIAGYLLKAGLGLEDVVQCNVFLVDMAEFQAMNDAYGKFFPKEPPARTTVGSSGLYGGARVEIDCTAAAR